MFFKSLTCIHLHFQTASAAEAVFVFHYTLQDWAVRQKTSGFLTPAVKGQQLDLSLDINEKCVIVAPSPLPSFSLFSCCLFACVTASQLSEMHTTKRVACFFFFFTAPAKHEHVLMHERSSMHPEIFVLCKHNRLLLRRHLVGITLNSIGVFVVSGCSIK